MSSTNSEYRNNLEIIASILNVCQHKTKKTHLMKQCNMSFKQLTSYLDLLLETNLLLIENEGHFPQFRVSSKGKDFLKAYDSLKTMVME